MDMKKEKRPVDWSLCFVADSEAAVGMDILHLIAEVVEGGATLIQLRGKKWTSREFLDGGIEAARFLRRRKIPLIINDRVDIAIACNADGVHLGQDDIPLPCAREILGKSRIIGISASTVKEAQTAEKGGADYIGVGPIFRTLSKQDAGPILGLEGLSAIREAVKIPILAIGGISASNAADVVPAGADGVAVISAITSAARPQKAAAKIVEAIRKQKPLAR
jgi:thiamine-phosphate pyrophosphorylase